MRLPGICSFFQTSGAIASRHSWDRDGFAAWAKRLEEGPYAMAFEDDGNAPRREITAQELGALLSGINLSVAKRRKRYQRKHAEAA